MRQGTVIQRAASSQSAHRAYYTSALVALLAIGQSLALAADNNFRVSGFGTLAYAADNNKQLAAARDISQKPKDSFSTGNSWKIDSRLGVQAELVITPMADLVGQVVVRDHVNANLNSSTELAYLALRPTAEINLRGGRISYDAFMMSDHRHVGYAYTWVRPPLEFYGWIPIFSLDGIDASYTLEVDNATWRIKAQAGRSTNSIPIGDGYDFRANDLLGISLTRQSDLWRIKAAYSLFSGANEVPAFAPLHNGLDQVIAAGIPGISQEAVDLRHNLSFQNARISYATLGLAYDDGSWLLQSELGRSTADAASIPHGRMAYLSLGHRFADWTPYVMRSTSRPGNDRRPALNDWAPINAQSLQDIALFTLNSTRMEQDTWSVGTRWDVHPQATLKLQWDHTKIKPSGYGLWWRDPAINGQTTQVNLLTATLDFVF